MSEGTLKLLAVDAVSPELPTFNTKFGNVTYGCRQAGDLQAIYFRLKRPSYRNGIQPPWETPGMKITLAPGLNPFSSKASAEFCGPVIDGYLASLVTENVGDNHAAMPRVLAPLLRGELSQFRLT
jgi:hypothetical protein